jgi:hypothetical protein
MVLWLPCTTIMLLWSDPSTPRCWRNLKDVCQTNDPSISINEESNTILAACCVPQCQCPGIGCWFLKPIRCSLNHWWRQSMEPINRLFHPNLLLIYLYYNLLLAGHCPCNYMFFFLKWEQNARIKRCKQLSLLLSLYVLYTSSIS